MSHSSFLKMEKIWIGCGVCAERLRLLDITGACAADTSGWPVDGRMGRLRWEKESPRAAAGADEFRAQARPQPSFTARLPDLPEGWCEAGTFIRAREGSFDCHQARQPRSKRQRVAEFEPANVFGVKPSTI
jgi:hypothetical protein